MTLYTSTVHSVSNSIFPSDVTCEGADNVTSCEADVSTVLFCLITSAKEVMSLVALISLFVG